MPHPPPRPLGLSFGPDSIALLTNTTRPPGVVLWRYGEACDMARRKPNTILVGDDKYRATVFKVDEHDPDGVPRKLTMVGDNEEVELQGGEHFVILYMRQDMLRVSKGDA